MNETAYWIALSGVSGIGPVKFRMLLDRFGSPREVWSAPVSDLRTTLDRRTLDNLLSARRTVDPTAARQRMRDLGASCLTWDDPAYPQNLRMIDAPPPVLYVRGTLDERDATAVAVVGTRRASAYGREIAHRVATELAKNQVTVVSGLALGIDTVAHKAALDAGGRTIAVLGSGVDQIYPLQNRRLARQMMERGAVVSDYPLETRPEPRNFPPRNRIISGLSRCVVIVEAGERSGALITADFAADQGRDVFAVPGSILHAGCVGCNRLIQQGAAPLLAPDDLLAALEPDTRRAQLQARHTISNDPAEEQLLAALTTAPTHFDDLIRLISMPSAQVSSLLTVLELKGQVRQIMPMVYVRSA